MKTKLNLLLLSILFLFASCDKEARLENKLQGSWELRRNMGGFREAGSQSNFPPGNGNIVKFDDDKYERYSGGKLQKSVEYVIKGDKLEIDGTNFSYRLVDPGNDRPLKEYFKVSGNKLLISSGSMAHDGVTSTYEKLY